MKLSKNFSLEEMCSSNTARVKGLPNVPNAEQVKNLQQLCKKVLQPLRDHRPHPRPFPRQRVPLPER